MHVKPAAAAVHFLCFCCGRHSFRLWAFTQNSRGAVTHITICFSIRASVMFSAPGHHSHFKAYICGLFLGLCWKPGIIMASNCTDAGESLVIYTTGSSQRRLFTTTPHLFCFRSTESTSAVRSRRSAVLHRPPLLLALGCLSDQVRTHLKELVFNSSPNESTGSINRKVFKIKTWTVSLCRTKPKPCAAQRKSQKSQTKSDFIFHLGNIMIIVYRNYG